MQTTETCSWNWAVPAIVHADFRNINRYVYYMTLYLYNTACDHCISDAEPKALAQL